MAFPNKAKCGLLRKMLKHMRVINEVESSVWIWDAFPQVVRADARGLRGEIQILPVVMKSTAAAQVQTVHLVFSQDPRGNVFPARLSVSPNTKTARSKAGHCSLIISETNAPYNPHDVRRNGAPAI